MRQHVRRAQPSAAFPFLSLLGLLLLLAPVFRGGNRPLPLLGLELLALGLVVLMVLYRHNPWSVLGRWERLAVGLLVAIPVISLLPLPMAWWGALPGRAIYQEALGLFGAQTGWHSLTVVPFASQASALALLPPLAVFLATLVCGDEDRKRLIYLFLAVATIEAVLGLSQYGSREEFLLFGMDPGNNAKGTYPNYNHFAGLFEMAIPLAAALFAANFGHKAQQHRRYHRRGLRAIFAKLGETRINIAFLFIALFMLFGLAAVFSRSRTGIALLILSVLLLTLAFAPRLGGKQTLRTAAGLVTLLAGLSLAVGLVPVLQRFADQDPLADARWSIASATLEGVGAFFPLGAGVGTYPEVFRSFHPGDVPKFVNNAHNDYLEWLFEGGLLAGIVILLGLAVYVRRVLFVLQGDQWRQDQYIKIGAAIGLLLILLHSFVDYNLHIPANAIYFAFLAGLLFAHREHWTDGKRAETQQEEKPQSTPQTASVPARQAAPLPPSNLPDNVPNPFAL